MENKVKQKIVVCESRNSFEYSVQSYLDSGWRCVIVSVSDNGYIAILEKEIK